jgi:hypothetical protein
MQYINFSAANSLFNPPRFPLTYVLYFLYFSSIASAIGRDELQNYHEYGQYHRFTGYPI